VNQNPPPPMFDTDWEDDDDEMMINFLLQYRIKSIHSFFIYTCNLKPMDAENVI
jgi:hypothetical protein